MAGIRALRSIAVALTLVGVAASAATAGAAPGAKLRVTQLGSPPATLVAGESLVATGKVRNSGKEDSSAKLRVLLDGPVEAVLEKFKLADVDAKSSVGFSKRADVPASLPGGSYRLVACVRKNGTTGKERCRTAKGTLELTGSPPIEFTPGARTLGDPLFPQTGNGGYDASHYAIDLDYDPGLNVFTAATTRITATATHNLSELSLDFQDLDVSSVTVNGQPAAFAQVDATPQLSSDPEVTQPMKLVVTPTAGIPAGAPLEIVVSYSGAPVRMTDADLSFEGWIPACYGPGQTAPCDGGFVVNQPNGAQTWFPSNNYPTDKATYETTITVPTTHTAFGIGELASRTVNGDGTWTWTWDEDDPASTYLTTATVGLFDYSLSAMIETSTSRALAVYDGIDSSYDPTPKANLTASLAETPAMLNYLSDLYGPYPFDSIGAVVDRTTGVGYALEVLTKPHYSQIGSSSQDISSSTQLHEIAHMWFGNSLTLKRWTDLWIHEGWAVWSEWIWGFEVNGGDSPEDVFDDLYATLPDEFWEIAPAVLEGDPANLFNGAVYDRGAMVVEGTRQILGEAGFEELIDALMADRRYGTISTEEFIDLAAGISGFTGAQLADLEEFYDQWLYAEEKPTLLPGDVITP